MIFLLWLLERKTKQNEWACWLKGEWFVLDYLRTLCELQKLFVIKWYEKIVIFGEIERTVEVLVVGFKISLAYTWRDWGKSQKRSVMIIVSILAEIWTGHLSNAGQKCYHVSHLAWFINKSIIWIWCSHSGDCEEHVILVCNSM